MLNFKYLLAFLFVLLLITGCTQPDKNKDGGGEDYYTVDNPDGAPQSDIDSANGASEEISEIMASIIDSISGLGGGESGASGRAYRTNKIEKSSSLPFEQTISGSVSGSIHVYGTSTIDDDEELQTVNFSMNLTFEFTNYNDGGNYTINGTLTETQEGKFTYNVNVTIEPPDESDDKSGEKEDGDSSHAFSMSVSSTRKGTIFLTGNELDNVKLTMDCTLTITGDEEKVVCNGTYKYTMNDKTWTVTSRATKTNGAGNGGENSSSTISTTI